MKVNAVVCCDCGDTVFSRAGHDMRECGCGSLAVDGGFGYVKISGVGHKLTVIDIPQTRDELYCDWNERKDKYGLIKGAKKR